jgi:hypothetical protein
MALLARSSLSRPARIGILRAAALIVLGGGLVLIWEYAPAWRGLAIFPAFLVGLPLVFATPDPKEEMRD